MTRAPADVHKLDAEVRSQARTLPYTWFTQLWNDYWFSFNLLNIARRPAAEGPRQQTRTRNACAQAQRTECALWFSILSN